MTATDETLGESSEHDEDTNEVSSDDDGGKGGESKKRSNPNSATEEDKKAERRAANRRSAFQSRQRRKILIEDLQRTVAALSKDNGELQKSNEELRAQLESTMLENHQFRMQQQLTSTQGGSAAGLLGGSAGLPPAHSRSLWRGGGQSVLSQMIGSGASSGLGGSASTQPGNAGGAPGSDDPLLNARLALAAAQTRGSGQGLTSEPSQPSAATLQSLLESAKAGAPASSQVPAALRGVMNDTSISASSGAGPASAAGGNQLSAIQALLQNSAGQSAAPAGAPTGGAPAPSSHLGGLQSLLESAARGGAPAPDAAAPAAANHPGLQGVLETLQRSMGTQHAPAAGLSDIQRALLQGASGLSPMQQSQSDAGAGNNQAALSEALRNILQQKNGG